MRSLLLPLIALACASPSGLPAPRPALDAEVMAHMRCAAESQSTATSYVWVAVFDPETGEEWSVVVSSAVVYEEIRRNPESQLRLPAAPEFRPIYDASLLAAARRHLSRFSDEEIEFGLTPATQFGPIREFVATRYHDAPDAALAHALFERGFFPYRGDYTPTMYVNRTVCRTSPPPPPNPLWDEDYEEVPARL